MALFKNGQVGKTGGRPIYSLGENPVAFLNSLENTEISLNPERYADSVTEYTPDSRSSFALVILRVLM